MPELLHQLPVLDHPAPHRVRDVVRVLAPQRLVPDVEVQLVVAQLRDLHLLLLHVVRDHRRDVELRLRVPRPAHLRVPCPVVDYAHSVLQQVSHQGFNNLYNKRYSLLTLPQILRTHRFLLPTLPHQAVDPRVPVLLLYRHALLQLLSQHAQLRVVMQFRHLRSIPYYTHFTTLPPLRPPRLHPHLPCQQLDYVHLILRLFGHQLLVALLVERYDFVQARFL